MELKCYSFQTNKLRSLPAHSLSTLATWMTPKMWRAWLISVSICCSRGRLSILTPAFTDNFCRIMAVTTMEWLVKILRFITSMLQKINLDRLSINFHNFSCNHCSRRRRLTEKSRWSTLSSRKIWAPKISRSINSLNRLSSIKIAELTDSVPAMQSPCKSITFAKGSNSSTKSTIQPI